MEYTVGPGGSDIDSGTIDTARTILGDTQEIYSEIDAMLKVMRLFWNMDPQEVMQNVSMISARTTEMKIQLSRIELTDKSYQKVRTTQVEPVLTECEKQFRIASRNLEFKKQEWQLNR